MTGGWNRKTDEIADFFGKMPMDVLPKILLMIESSRTCEREFLRGIARYARLYGPWAFYHKPKFYLKSNRREMPVSQIKNFDPDGIIVSDTEKIDEILSLGCPTIIHTFKSEQYDVPTVLGDTVQAGQMGAEHLLGLGCEHFAYCGIGDYYWSRGRFNSFRQTIEQAGFSSFYYELKPRRMHDRRQNELRLLAEWLKSLPTPLGLMTCADDCSQLVVEACKASGLHIPEQISLIGVDNDDMICELSNPPLSSIALNFEAAGYQTAELLDSLINNRPVQETSVHVLPSHVEVRASTDMLAINDPDVATALKFIRENSNKLIQTADVVNAVACSQRTLHNKFLKNIGRSVHHEIKRSRVERIAKMLRETDRTVSQIARQLGYFNVNHISRYFEQEMGIKPLVYRKKMGGIG